MTKLIDVQFPVLDHAESRANIAIVTESAKEFTIVAEKTMSQMFLILINHGDRTTLTVKDTSVIIEVPHGVSAIRLQDLPVNYDGLNFKLADNSEVEYFVVGHYIREVK